MSQNIAIVLFTKGLSKKYVNVCKDLVCIWFAIKTDFELNWSQNCDLGLQNDHIIKLKNKLQLSNSFVRLMKENKYLFKTKLK